MAPCLPRTACNIICGRAAAAAATISTIGYALFVAASITRGNLHLSTARVLFNHETTKINGNSDRFRYNHFGRKYKDRLILKINIETVVTFLPKMVRRLRRHTQKREFEKFVRHHRDCWNLRRLRSTTAGGRRVAMSSCMHAS